MAIDASGLVTLSGVSMGETGSGADVELSADKYAEIIALDTLINELKSLKGVMIR